MPQRMRIAPRRHAWRVVTIALTWALALGACSPRDRDRAPNGSGSGRLALEPCRLPQVGRPARCGRLSVFENRAAAEGRQLELFVALLPATSRKRAADPLVLLAGGPGQGATDSWGPLLPSLAAINQERDILWVDQRGTGRSAALACDMHADDLTEVVAEDAISRVATECRAGLDADLSQYTTPIAADDLDDVRAALGYEQLNLLGMSYGTRLALSYLRRHPSHVRSVILDGVAPTSMALPLYAARDGQRAWDRLLADCQADPACREAYPTLAEDFRALLDRLGERPAATTVAHPRTGESVDLELGRAAFAGGVRGLLYSVELSSLLPHTVMQARSGNFDPFVAQVALLTEQQAEVMSLGLFLSVLCTEDVDRIEQLEPGAELDDTFLGASMVRDMQRACDGWPRAQLPAGYVEPTRSDRPVLVLSGDLDPITPPSWGELAAEHLPASKHVVVPGVGHGTVIRGCVPELVEQFVREGSASSLEVDCVSTIRRPPFFIDSAGPVH